MTVIFDHYTDEAATIRTFFFRSSEPLHYTAGQFIELYVPHEHEDDRGHKRWFTLSSSPTDELLSITTKYAGDDKSSTYKRALFELQPDTELRMSDPMGDFVLPKLIQTPLIFVAGGIGITPYRSMLEWLAASNETRPIKLLIGVRNEDEIVFQETFDKAGQHATIIVSDASPAWGGERGQLSAEKILGLEAPDADTLVYLSGPEVMVEQLGNDLVKAGIRKQQIVGDYFPNYTTI